jgi:hypothetical protein
MKTIFLVLAMICYFNVSILGEEKEQTAEEKSMIKLVADIIDTPARMIETMENNETIDCSKIVKLFKDYEWTLIDFTLSIAYLRYTNFEYDGIDVSINSKTNEKIYVLFYSKDKKLNSEENIKFVFIKKDDKVIFNGISKPIG